MASIADRLKRRMHESNSKKNCEITKRPKEQEHMNPAKLTAEFYNRSCTDLAQALLGKILVRTLDNSTQISGRIVETECYLGGEDKASHSYNGRQTNRTTAMYMDPGTAYVYVIYGMYHCFNISSEGSGAVVLIRSLEPVEGKEQMRIFRKARRKETSKQLKEHELCNGPSKLCQALQIEKESINCQNLVNSKALWIETDGSDKNTSLTVVQSKRIGIESAGEEWANKLLRYYVKNCKSVSVRDKNAETELSNS